MRGRKQVELVPYSANSTAIKKESPNEGTETSLPMMDEIFILHIKKESPNEGTETGLQETATVNESGLYKKRIPE